MLNLDSFDAINFEVSIEEKEITLPNDTIMLKANCHPKITSKRGWMYHYEWDIEDKDKHPPELNNDSSTPDFVQVSRLTEGEHTINVKVTCSKRSDTECGNIDGNSNSVVRYGIGKITVKSGN